MQSAVLAGVGSWLPPRQVTNEEIGARVGRSAEWMFTRSGIRSRRIAEPGTTTGDLAVRAGRAALRSAGAQGADAVVVATTTPDRTCPGTAPHVASRLGLDGVAALDVQAVCAGFLYGLGVAQGLIAARTAGSVLLIGADMLSPYLDPYDPSATMLFGDGGGAVLLRAGHAGEPGCLGPMVLGSDGSGRDLITVRADGCEDRSLRAGTEAGERQGGGGGQAGREDTAEADGESPRADRHMRLRGTEVFRRAVESMESCCRQAAAAAGWKLDEVDRIAAHQANARILTMLGSRLGVTADRLLSNIEHVGNTSAASVPVLLDHAHRAGGLKSGQRVLLTAFGGGLAWGATTTVWPHLAPPGRP